MSTGIFPLLYAGQIPDTAGVQEERDILRQRITDLLEDQGKTARSVSMEATGKPDVIRDMLRHKSSPNGPTLGRIAQVLDTTTDYLLGKAATPDQPRSEVSFRDAPAAFKGQENYNLPVLGTAYCDDLVIEQDEDGSLSVERLMLDVDHVVRMVERPPALWNATDAYGIYYHGSSMEPRFYQGELGIVDPRRPPSPGDFVVVQLTSGDNDDVITVLVKQLVRIAGDHVHLRQFNPDQTFVIKRSIVARLHRICSNNELFG